MTELYLLAIMLHKKGQDMDALEIFNGIFGEQSEFEKLMKKFDELDEEITRMKQAMKGDQE